VCRVLSVAGSFLSQNNIFIDIFRLYTIEIQSRFCAGILCYRYLLFINFFLSLIPREFKEKKIAVFDKQIVVDGIKKGLAKTSPFFIRQSN
jgi:hypothetical protein